MANNEHIKHLVNYFGRKFYDWTEQRYRLLCCIHWNLRSDNADTTNEHIPYLLETLIGLYHSRLHQLLSISIIIHKPLSLNYPALKLEIISFRFPRSFFFSQILRRIFFPYGVIFYFQMALSLLLLKNLTQGYKSNRWKLFWRKDRENKKKGEILQSLFLTCSFL